MNFSLRLNLQGQVVGTDSEKYHYLYNITSRILPESKRLKIPLSWEEQMEEESQTESFHNQYHLQRGVMLSGSSCDYTKDKSQIKSKSYIFFKYNILPMPHLIETHLSLKHEPSVDLTQLKMNKKNL